MRITDGLRLAAVVCGPWLTAVALSGCSGAPEPTYSVRGTVRIDGEPLAFGDVLFQSVPNDPGAESYTARATIESDGSYELSTFEPGDGAVAGRHRVAVLAMSLAPEAGPVDEPTVPLRYRSPSTSGIEVVVEPRSNEIDLDLTRREQPSGDRAP